MELQNQIIIGFIGILVAYFALRYFAKQEVASRVRADPYSDILTSEKYKVKGQWEKD